MQKYIKDKIKNDNNQLYTLYYLKVKTKISLLNLLNTKYNVYNESIDDILKKYYIEINNNIKSNNIDKVIDYLFFILDFYDKLYNSKWIKSIGEFYGLMSLILFLISKSNFVVLLTTFSRLLIMVSNMLILSFPFK